MKKHVWILNHYAGSMYVDKGGRHYNFAKYLKQAGYEPMVFCAVSRHGKPEPYFEMGGLWEERTAEAIGVPWVFVKARTYVGNGKQRILNMLDFYRNVKKAAKEYAARHGKPDIIYASSVHPLTLLAGIQLAKRFGVECVCEVRDLWPESLAVLNPKRFPRNSLPVKLLYRGEKWLYQKADRLVFTMEGGGDYIRERGWEKAVPLSKVFYINNGVDLEAFYKNVQLCRAEDPDLDAPDVFKLVYAGAVRMANGLDQLLRCAELLRDRSDIRFLIYGGGEALEDLNAQVRDRGLTNVCLKGPVKKEEIPYILSKSSACLLNYAKEAPEIFRYGSSNNKLFEYLAAGRPVISNIEINYSPIEREGCGVFSASPSSEDYAGAVLRICELSKEEYAAMCENARRAAQAYDFQALTRKLIDVLEAPSSAGRKE